MIMIANKLHMSVVSPVEMIGIKMLDELMIRKKVIL